MPEEINRVVTDRLSDLLFTPSREANSNLLAEGIPAERLHFVGNVMIDSLISALPAAERLGASARYGVDGEKFVVATLHRPSNVDTDTTLLELLGTLEVLGRERPVLFPVHPRTKKRIDAIWHGPTRGDLRLLEPMPYLEMMGLVMRAALVITDSGGLQEETSYLGVPCLTVRPNTERPVTCTQGTNQLVFPQRAAILEAAREKLSRGWPTPRSIERWDGKAAERIVAVICDGYRFD
jgi:UDP-N-acetylglucosamine 2-epimerase (non-hydrolysing)